MKLKKELMWSAKGNEMTFYWSHPEHSSVECLVVNGNTERDSVQYEERRTGSDAPSDAKHGKSPASLSKRR